MEIFEDSLENAPLTSTEFNSGLCSDLYEAKEDNYDFFTDTSDVALVRFIADVAVEGSGFELAFTSFYKSTGS